MLNRLLLRFRFVYSLAGRLDAAEKECSILRESNKEAVQACERLLEDIDTLKSQLAELQHHLEIERTKRIAAEQIAVSRGSELDWLREQFNRAETQREEARAEQLHSLDLVNVALLKGAEADRPPTKEEMAQWRPVPKQTRQSIPMIRRAEAAFLDGLRAKSRPAVAPTAEKVQ